MSRYKYIAIDPEIHRKAKAQAAHEGKSLNEYANEALRAKLAGLDGIPLSALLEQRMEYETQEAT